MVRNPSEPSGSINDPKQASDPPRVAIFDHSGKEIRQHDKPGRDTETPSSTSGQIPASAEVILDDDPALDERIIKQAAKSAQKHADELGEALYAKFMHILTKQLDEQDGRLTAADIESMGREFRDELVTIENVFLEAVEAFTLARETGRADQSRRKVFQRLMVNNFEHLFANEHELREQPELISRRMLPGFFTVLVLMLGEQKLTGYEKEAETLIEELRASHKGHLSWAEIYAAPKVRRLCLRAEIQIAQHFVETEKRLLWMIGVINSNLIPSDIERSQKPWELTTKSAEKILKAIFRDLRVVLKKQKMREKMAKRFDLATITLLDKIVGRFQEN